MEEDGEEEEVEEDGEEEEVEEEEETGDTRETEWVSSYCFGIDFLRRRWPSAGYIPTPHATVLAKRTAERQASPFCERTGVACKYIDTVL